MAKPREFQVITGLPVADLQIRLGELSAEGWDVAAFSATPAGAHTVLVSREVKRKSKLLGGDGPSD